MSFRHNYRTSNAEDGAAAALRSHLVYEGKITDSDRGIMRAYERIGRERGREDLLFEQSVADDWARFKENEKREDAKWKAKEARAEFNKKAKAKKSTGRKAKVREVERRIRGRKGRT